MAELGAADDEGSRSGACVKDKTLFLLLFCLLTVYQLFCLRKHNLPYSVVFSRHSSRVVGLIQECGTAVASVTPSTYWDHVNS